MLSTVIFLEIPFPYPILSLFATASPTSVPINTLILLPTTFPRVSKLRKAVWCLEGAKGGEMKQARSDSSLEEQGKGRLGTSICWQFLSHHTVLVSD